MHLFSFLSLHTFLTMHGHRDLKPVPYLLFGVIPNMCNLTHPEDTLSDLKIAEITCPKFHS